MRLATVDILVDLEVRLIQVRKLGVISNKKKIQRDGEEEENRVSQQQSIAIVEIIN